MTAPDRERPVAAIGDTAVAVRATPVATAGVPPRVHRLVAAMVLANVVGLALLVLLVPATWPGWGGLAVVSAFTALSHIDSAYIHLVRREVQISFSFSEIGALLALVLLPGVYTVLAILLGSIVYETVTRRAPIKAAFNVAQHGLGAATAATVMATLPPLGVPAFGESLVSASLAVLAYVLVTLVAWLLLLVLLTGEGSWQDLAPSVGVDAVASVAATSVGVVALYLWSHDVVLLAYLVAPLLAIVAAYRYLRATQELTERRSADADRLRRLVSSTTDGIVMVEDDGRVEVWNSVMETLTGVAAGTAEGRPLTEVMKDVRRTGPAPLGADADTVATWADDHVLEERSARVHGGEYGDAGRVIVLRDVTSQQEAEALKSDFVARVSHELRTPLTPLSGFIELLRKQGDRFDPERRETALDAMARNARRMTALVDELLRVVEIDEGRLDQRSAAIDLAPVAGAAPQRLRLDASTHRILIEVPAGTFAMGDAERLTDVLGHLLDNAVRYSPAGSTVRLEAVADGAHVLLRVHDEGPGIPQAAREVVFDRFSRLEGPLRMRTSGLGLGLFVARRLAEAMNGTVQIAKSDHRGTIMEVRLPTLA